MHMHATGGLPMDGYEERTASARHTAEAELVRWIDGLLLEQRVLVLGSERAARAWADMDAHAKRRWASGEGGHSDAGMDRDAGEMFRASYEPSPAEWCDSAADNLAELAGCDLATAEALSRWHEERMADGADEHERWLVRAVVKHLDAAENVRVAAVALAFALSVPEVWLASAAAGQRQLLRCTRQMAAAAALGTSRQNLSKEVRRAAAALGITEGIHLKNTAAVESFRQAKLRRHWRGTTWRRGMGGGR